VREGFGLGQLRVSMVAWVRGVGCGLVSVRSACVYMLRSWCGVGCGRRWWVCRLRQALVVGCVRCLVERAVTGVGVLGGAGGVHVRDGTIDGRVVWIDMPRGRALHEPQ